jgi:hypothetical protein
MRHVTLGFNRVVGMVPEFGLDCARVQSVLG